MSITYLIAQTQCNNQFEDNIFFVIDVANGTVNDIANYIVNDRVNIIVKVYTL